MDVSSWSASCARSSIQNENSRDLWQRSLPMQCWRAQDLTRMYLLTPTVGGRTSGVLLLSLA